MHTIVTQKAKNDTFCDHNHTKNERRKTHFLSHEEGDKTGLKEQAS
jgi:hypothetical protein